MTKLERAKNLAKALELATDSLNSHLEATYKKGGCNRRKCQKESGNLKFHRTCVLEYATVIKTLAEELEKL